jgi:hypothetical protein
MIVLVILFATITIYSERRGSTGDYGRLLERGMPTVEQKPVEIVHEAPPLLDEAKSADPMLVGAMSREQWLTGAVDEPARVEEIETATAMAWRTGTATEDRIAIVGGPEGVEVVRQTRRRQVLSGGFGR